MRCPKCGHDNPSDTLFCEECDWRLDVPYRPPKKRNPLAFALVSLVIGAAALVLAFLDGTAGIGLVLSMIGFILGLASVIGA